MFEFLVQTSEKYSSTTLADNYILTGIKRFDNFFPNNK